MKVNGKYIRGYCVPNYSKKATYNKSNVVYKIKIDNTKIDIPEIDDKKLFGEYKTTADLNMRIGAGLDKKIITVIPKNTFVKNTGFYSKYNSTKWCIVIFNKDNVIYTGYVSCNYLEA